MSKRFYVAYGSNLNVIQMHFRCPCSKVVGTAEIPDYQLLFKGSKTGAYLTIEPCKGKSVPVAIWEVTAKDELALDRYEGFPTFYYKANLTLPIKGIKSGQTLIKEAFAYIMDESRTIEMPSERYVKICLDGYKAFGFDENKLFDALNISLEKSRNEE